MKAVANHHLMTGLNFSVLLRGTSYRSFLIDCLGLGEGLEESLGYYGFCSSISAVAIPVYSIIISEHCK